MVPATGLEGRSVPCFFLSSGGYDLWLFLACGLITPVSASTDISCDDLPKWFGAQIPSYKASVIGWELNWILTTETLFPNDVIILNSRV